MKRLSALLVLAACAHHAEDASDYHAEMRDEHTCDPKGADVARYVEPAALEEELFPDEVALRGKCFDRQTEGLYRPRNPDELSMELMRDVLSGRECTGVCAPMDKALPALDEKHDLEDETLQRECTAAAGKLEARIRGGCRHVCIVERRKLASKAIFARTMRGLSGFARKLPASDDELRKTWIATGEPLPPRRFLFTIEPGKQVKAEGAYWPGGPLLRLHLFEGDAGCGQSQWTVETW